MLTFVQDLIPDAIIERALGGLGYSRTDPAITNITDSGAPTPNIPGGGGTINPNVQAVINQQLGANLGGNFSQANATVPQQSQISRGNPIGTLATNLANRFITGINAADDVIDRLQGNQSPASDNIPLYQGGDISALDVLNAISPAARAGRFVRGLFSFFATGGGAIDNIAGETLGLGGQPTPNVVTGFGDEIDRIVNQGPRIENPALDTITRNTSQAFNASDPIGPISFRPFDPTLGAFGGTADLLGQIPLYVFGNTIRSARRGIAGATARFAPNRAFQTGYLDEQGNLQGRSILTDFMNLLEVLLHLGLQEFLENLEQQMNYSH